MINASGFSNPKSDKSETNKLFSIVTKLATKFWQN